MKERHYQLDTNAAASGQKRTADEGESFSPKDVRRIGTKLREMRESEREKRPEIVRITSISDKHVDEAGVSLQSAFTVTHEASQSHKHRRQKSTRHHRSARWGVGSRSNTLIDRWVPDTSKLSRSVAESNHPESTSAFVWLHGLPKPCTSLMIQRFFSGLEPQRVLVLLRNSADFPTWDADHHSGPPRKKTMVDRYSSNELRVLVQFANAPTAALAAERSKEVMMFQKQQPSGDDSDGDSVSGAAVAVTVVPRAVAQAVEHLTVDGEISVPLDVTESKVRAKLDPIVVKVLWTAAIRDLRLSDDVLKNCTALDRESDNTVWYPHILERESSRSRQWHQNMRKDHESLLKDYLRLLYRHPLLTFQDLELLRIDPVTRLTERAISTLKREMETREKLAVQRRVLLGGLES